MTIDNPQQLTTFEVWSPKYSTKFGKEGEWCALIPVYKVDAATAVFIVKWTKAKHLLGLRHCIRKSQAQEHPVTNVKNKQGGITPMYTIPLSKFDTWITKTEEAQQIKESIGILGW